MSFIFWEDSDEGKAVYPAPGNPGIKLTHEFSQMTKYQIVSALIEREQLRYRVKELEEKLNKPNKKEHDDHIRP